MEWKRCAGSGQLAVWSEAIWSTGGRPMCPVCTKYVTVKVGQIIPAHDAVVINSTPINYPQESRQ